MGGADAVTVTTCRLKREASEWGIDSSGGIVLVGSNGGGAESDRGAIPCSDGKTERIVRGCRMVGIKSVEVESRGGMVWDMKRDSSSRTRTVRNV